MESNRHINTIDLWIKILFTAWMGPVLPYRWRENLLQKWGNLDNRRVLARCILPNPAFLILKDISHSALN